MIKLENLTFKYNDGPSFNFPDIDLPDQENLLITGNSGVGKSTLLHLLSGIRRPSSGQIIINKTNIENLNAAQLDKYRGTNMGLIFQQPHFVSGLSSYENVRLALNISIKDSEQYIYQIFERLGIEKRMNYSPSKMSLGEKQRLGIARAIVNKPKVLYADEPTSSLDDSNTEIVIELLLEEARINNSQLVCITHDHRVKKYFENEVNL
ncbi:ABC transporter ATP-binding protein [Marinigracilibium pacificum]|uniref:ATP-binding cassette domain-containing protein n=1 Tax=Marinigracilibium pacificum TaxID=2729599 RepID=A0A848J114_9BACT|nr:ATP-binding cassette domain-containing protein [Marinigracilibium pacificum]NMM46932.1 ATP-binding cassette domain-containing protein [Marinigracilibium pacificum]